MLEVQKYLMTHSLEELKETYGIDTKIYDDCVLLNYSQIDSPKEELIVKECRGIILSKDYKHILCKSFTRFFNYGECKKSQEGFSFDDSVVYEKIDGSLIRMWFHNNKWNIASRSMAYAEGFTSTNINTFYDCVMKCFEDGEFEDFCSYLNPTFTYVFELVSPENRVVKSYGSEYNLYYLSCFDNRTGKEERRSEVVGETMDIIVEKFKNIKYPKTYALKNYNEILSFMNSLNATDEGFVVYDNKSGIRVKIKNPSYLAIASKRMNNGLTEKSIIDMVFSNETAEYLTYFEEDRVLIEPYIEAYDKLVSEILEVWNKVSSFDTSTHEGRKEFALTIKSNIFSSIIFGMKDGKSMKELLLKASDRSKNAMISHYL